MKTIAYVILTILIGMILGILIGVIGLELLFRIRGPINTKSAFTQDNVFGVVYDPKKGDIRGYLSPQKNDKTIRIMSLGYSTTWGGIGNLETTYPAMLADTLNEKYGDKFEFEFVNYGVSGAHLAEMIETIESDRPYAVDSYSILDVEPDIVTIAPAWNDIQNIKKKLGKKSTYSWKFKTANKIADKLKDDANKSGVHHYLYYFANTVWMNEMFKDDEILDDVVIAEYHKQLSYLVNVWKEREAQVVLVGMPSSTYKQGELSGGEWAKFARPVNNHKIEMEIIERVGKELNVSVVNSVDSELEQLDFETRKKYFYDYIHFNADVHKMLASAIVEKINVDSLEQTKRMDFSTTFKAGQKVSLGDPTRYKIHSAKVNGNSNVIVNQPNQTYKGIIDHYANAKKALNAFNPQHRHLFYIDYLQTYNASDKSGFPAIRFHSSVVDGSVVVPAELYGYKTIGIGKIRYYTTGLAVNNPEFNRTPTGSWVISFKGKNPNKSFFEDLVDMEVFIQTKQVDLKCNELTDISETGNFHVKPKYIDKNVVSIPQTTIGTLLRLSVGPKGAYFLVDNQPVLISNLNYSEGKFIFTLVKDISHAKSVKLPIWRMVGNNKEIKLELEYYTLPYYSQCIPLSQDQIAQVYY